MNFTVEKINNDTLIILNEERVDAHNSAKLKEVLLQQLEQGNHLLIVQLANVRFIDSSGLGALLSGHKNATIKSGRLLLAGLQPQVLAMFELTRLNRVFEIYADVDEALAAEQ
ncbi:STAS domain-containing protein [Methylosoma difficile]